MFDVDQILEDAFVSAVRAARAAAATVERVLHVIGLELKAYYNITRGAVEESLGPLWSEFGPFLKTRTGAGAAVMKVAGLLGLAVPHPEAWTTVVLLLALSVGFALTLIGRKNASGPLISDRDVGIGLGRSPYAAVDTQPADPGFSAAHRPADAQ